MSVNTKNGKINILAVLLIAGICALVAARELFVGLSADEEYQLVLSYRLAHGDRLFAESWDTLQTSAFFGQLLMWLFLKVFKTTTGSLLFLRLCGILTQLAVSGYLFSTLKKAYRLCQCRSFVRFVFLHVYQACFFA